MYNNMQEALLAQGPFGDKKLNELALAYVRENDPVKKAVAYQKLERIYPGTWGSNNTISEQADFVTSAYADDLKNYEDANGEIFGDDLS